MAGGRARPAGGLPRCRRRLRGEPRRRARRARRRIAGARRRAGAGAACPVRPPRIGGGCASWPSCTIRCRTRRGFPPGCAPRLAASERRALAAAAGVIVTSDFTARRLRRFGVRADRVRVARPGTDPAPPAVGPGPGAPAAAAVGGGGRAAEGARRARARAGAPCAIWRGAAFAPAASSARRTTPARFAPWPPGTDLPAHPVRRKNAGARISTGSTPAARCSCSRPTTRLRDGADRGAGPGLPVVGTTGGAVPDTLPSDAALLAPPGDAGALAAAIGSLLDPDEAADGTGRGGAAGPGARRRAALASAALRHAAALPDWEAAARTFEEHLWRWRPSRPVRGDSALVALTRSRGRSPRDRHAPSRGGRSRNSR